MVVAANVDVSSRLPVSVVVVRMSFHCYLLRAKLEAHRFGDPEKLTKQGMATMNPAILLANWLKHTVEQVDHLRLQKLVFYAYGAAIGHDLDSSIGRIRFLAYKHGPVNPDVFIQHRGNGRSILPKPAVDVVPTYSLTVERVLNDVVTVYGGLSSWQLREESHLEAPWIHTQQSCEIDQEHLRSHFREKFRAGGVRMPRHLLRSSSFEVDGLPMQRWASLRELAQALS